MDLRDPPNRLIALVKDALADDIGSGPRYAVQTTSGSGHNELEEMAVGQRVKTHGTRRSQKETTRATRKWLEVSTVAAS